MVRDLLFPTTDAGVLAQVVGAALVLLVAAVLGRRNPDLLWFLGGVALLTAGLLALRTLH